MIRVNAGHVRKGPNEPRGFSEGVEGKREKEGSGSAFRGNQRDECRVVFWDGERGVGGEVGERAWPERLELD